MDETTRQGKTARQDWTLRVIAVIAGILIGWFANDLLGSRYSMVHTENYFFRINSRTGETWLYMAPRGWTPVPEPR